MPHTVCVTIKIWKHIFSIWGNVDHGYKVAFSEHIIIENCSLLKELQGKRAVLTLQFLSKKNQGFRKSTLIGNTFSSKMVLKFLSLFLTRTSRKLVSELYVLSIRELCSQAFMNSSSVCEGAGPFLEKTLEERSEDLWKGGNKKFSRLHRFNNRHFLAYTSLQRNLSLTRKELRFVCIWF